MESYITILTSYDFLLAKKGYLMSAVLKESKILKANKAVVTIKKELTLKDSKTKL